MKACSSHTAGLQHTRELQIILKTQYHAPLLPAAQQISVSHHSVGRFQN